MTTLPTAVVFDCDGVLVDSEPHSVVAWLDVLSGLGHPATAGDIAACVGLGFVPTRVALLARGPLPPADELWPMLLGALRRSFATGLTVFDDALEVLDAVTAAGIPVGVASASPRPRLDLTLRAGGLLDRFPVSVAGDEVTAAKPDPAIYLRALELLDATAPGSAAIEDTEVGALAAVRAGMRVVAVARTEDAVGPLRRTGAEVVDRLRPGLLGF